MSKLLKIDFIELITISLFLSLLFSCSPKKKVAITFDDGPDSLYTEMILDVLKEKNVKASFFLVGKNIEKYPEVVKRIKNENHLIGNHSYSHPRLRKITKIDSVEKEFAVVDSLLENIIGVKPLYYRPPFGKITDSQKELLDQKQSKIVMWSLDTKDYKIDDVTKDDIVTKVKENIHENAIILFHSTNANPERAARFKNFQNTVDALPEIIDFLKTEGYELVTIEQIPDKMKFLKGKSY